MSINNSPANNNTADNISRLVQGELENLFSEFYNSQIETSFEYIPINPNGVSNPSIETIQELISNGTLSDTRRLIETLMSQGQIPQTTTELPTEIPINNNNNINNRNSEHESDRHRFGNVLIETLTQLHANINEYNMNFRTYQQNVQEVIGMLRDMNMQNHNHIYTQPNRTNSNTPQFIYDPIRRTTTTNNPSRIRTNPIISHFLYDPLRQPAATNNPPTYLTEAQINLSTRIVPYSTEFTETRCAISLEDFTENEEIMQIIHCGHIFKTANLNNWFRRQNSCPTCRYNLNNYQPPIPNDHEDTQQLEIEVEVEMVIND